MLQQYDQNLNIGSLKLLGRIFLAPMHQINDVAFRILCKKQGADLTYTGLINPQTREHLYLEDKPAVQFACNSTKGIKEFIKKYDKKISLYDLNLGCPSPHAKQSKIGYFMINNLDVIEGILKEIKTYTKKPLTIKIRKMSLKQTKLILRLAEKYCDAVSVHPRTQKQGYSGIPDMNFARKIKSLLKGTLPVIYSGNITCKEEGDSILKEFDFCMIGRSAIGNPSIFPILKVSNFKNKVYFKEYLLLAKKYGLDFSQIKMQAMNFTKNMFNASLIREKISKTKKEKEIKDILFSAVASFSN
jgi:tRNA-dihydrouridine synthase